MTERLHFHFSPSCTGERNGNPLQYSCLENPRDGGAWWAAVYGVAQSQLDTTEATQQQQQQQQHIQKRNIFFVNCKCIAGDSGSWLPPSAITILSFLKKSYIQTNDAGSYFSLGTCQISVGVLCCVLTILLHDRLAVVWEKLSSMVKGFKHSVIWRKIKGAS